jgi:hypothetical protein
MENVIKSGKSIFLDMSKISYLSEDALLYLISRLDFLNSQYPNHGVQGNFPNDISCRELIMKSRFLRYVKTKVNYDEESEDIFPIHDGLKADGVLVSDVITFVKKYIDLGEFSERFYGPIMECLINTSNHAYRTETLNSKWWMIAIPELPKRRVHFTALDNGLGIPSTVRKNYLEKLESKFGKHLITGSTIDADLIYSALLGEYRTSTKIGYRGTGLPSIFELMTIPKVKNLRIISNHGHVFASENNNDCHIYRLKNKFHGTLISWDFVQ